MKFEPVLADRRFQLGEGPHYDAATGKLYWVDIVAGAAWCLDTASGESQNWTFGQPVSVAVPRAKGGLLVALTHGLCFFDPATGIKVPYASPEIALPGNRSNECRIDPAGRVWLGTMQNNIGPNGEDLPISKGTGALYRIEVNGRYEKLIADVGVSNTLCWDQARSRMYFADTMAGTIRAFTWDAASGAISNPRTFAKRNPYGLPDGSALDAEGYLWNARWGGGRIVRFDPDGGIDRVVEVPVTNPTSCVFGGPDLRTLYVTSARQGLRPDQLTANPLEGALLKAAADVPGQPCTRAAA